ncbi:hypothetical protein MTBLM1_10311 [Rhodospirillaceae bacterium LM-1]|nr:hypothetical protein MTBLM1_10311 [Rhodospirillaceae bacterium LM-1]
MDSKSVRPLALNSSQASEILGISENTLAQWRFRRQGPNYRKLGTSRRSKVLYLQRDIDDWLADLPSPLSSK